MASSIATPKAAPHAPVNVMSVLAGIIAFRGQITGQSSRVRPVTEP